MDSRHKAHELRLKSRTELLTLLDELKRELAGLRVAKVTGGAPNKLSKISIVRKAIHRVMTVYREQQKLQLVKSYRDKLAKHPEKKIHLPLDLRPKLTRAKRRQLTLEQKKKKTNRMQRKHYPRLRKYAIKA
eukprot:g7790.t1